MDIKYVLHDAEVNNIVCTEDGIELIFDKGVYVKTEQGNDYELLSPCRMIINIKYFDRSKLYEHISIIKHRNFKGKYIEYEDLLKLIEKHSFRIYIDYYSFFADSISLSGDCGDYGINLTITEVDKIDIIKG